jgi:hypothetical protein
MSVGGASLPVHRLVLAGSVLIVVLLLAVPVWRLAGSIEEFNAARSLHASVAGRIQAACLDGVPDGETLADLLGPRWGGDVTFRNGAAGASEGRCAVHDLHLAVRTDGDGMERMLADLARPGPLWLRDLQCESLEAGYLACAVELEAHLEAAP